MSSMHELEEDCLVKLREYIESLGGMFREGDWACRAQLRDIGSRAGSVDTWFTAPDGEVYRSKVAVARGLGLDPQGRSKGDGDKGGTPLANKKHSEKKKRKKTKDKPEEDGSPSSKKEKGEKKEKSKDGDANTGNNNKKSSGSNKRKPQQNTKSKNKSTAELILERRNRAPSVDLTHEDLAELLLSMPEAPDQEDTYNGHLVNKGKRPEAPVPSLPGDELIDKALQIQDIEEPPPPAADIIRPMLACTSTCDLTVRPRAVEDASVDYTDGVIGIDEEGVTMPLSEWDDETEPEEDRILRAAEIALRRVAILAARRRKREDAAVAAEEEDEEEKEEGAGNENGNGNGPVGMDDPQERRTPSPPPPPPPPPPESSPSVQDDKEDEEQDDGSVEEAVELMHTPVEDAAMKTESVEREKEEQEEEEVVATTERRTTRKGGGPFSPAAPEPRIIEAEVIRKCMAYLPERLDFFTPMLPLDREFRNADDLITSVLLTLPIARVDTPCYCTDDEMQKPAKKRKAASKGTEGDNEKEGAGGASEDGVAKKKKKALPPKEKAEKPPKQPRAHGGDGLKGRTTPEVEKALMDRLSSYVADLGGSLPDSWSVRAAVRMNGATAGGIDAYYYSPDGKRFKSMIKVAEELGLDIKNAVSAKARPIPKEITIAALQAAGVDPPAPKPLKKKEQGVEGTAPAVTDGGGTSEPAAIVAGTTTTTGEERGSGAGGGAAAADGEVIDDNSPKKPVDIDSLDESLDKERIKAIIAAGGQKGPIRKCGTCHTCTNPQLKKGCLFNKAIRDLMPEKPKDASKSSRNTKNKKRRAAYSEGEEGEEAAGDSDAEQRASMRRLQIMGPSPFTLRARRPKRKRNDFFAEDFVDDLDDEDLAPVPLDTETLKPSTFSLRQSGGMSIPRVKIKGPAEPAPPPCGCGGGGGDSGDDDYSAAVFRVMEKMLNNVEEQYDGTSNDNDPHDYDTGVLRLRGGGGGGGGGTGTRSTLTRPTRQKTAPERFTPGSGQKTVAATLQPDQMTAEQLAEEEKKKAARAARRERRDRLPPRNAYDRAVRRLQGQLTRLRQEQALVEAYAADGWRGASREKVKPTAEIARAKEQIGRIKDTIKECVRVCDEAEGDTAIPKELYDEEGELDMKHIICSKCQGQECDDDNDIILCDGPCDRAYHFKCLDPPITDPSSLPEDDGWLCHACDRKVDMIDLINDEFGTDYDVETPWQDIFAPGTLYADASPHQQTANGHSVQHDGPPVNLGRLDALLLEGADLPSEDEDDEDYKGSDVSHDDDENIHEDDEEKKSTQEQSSPSSSSISGRGRRRNSGSSGDEESLEAEDLLTGDRSIDDVVIEHPLKLSSSSSSEEDKSSSDSAVVVHGKRKRAAVDYTQLAVEMFGNSLLEREEPDDEDDGAWSPTINNKKKGNKNET